MKKLNLFLIALTCATLWLVGCSSPASSSESSYTELDFSKPLDNWITGTWEITQVMQISSDPALDDMNGTQTRSGKAILQGNNDTDACELSFNNKKETDVTTVKDFKEYFNKEGCKKGLPQNATTDYSCKVNNDKNEIILSVISTWSMTESGTDYTIKNEVTVTFKKIN